jgi:hypothetical protein
MTSRKNSGAMMSACPRLGYMISFPRGSRHAVSANISGVQKSSWTPQITSVSVWMSSSRSRTSKASSARNTAIVSAGFSIFTRLAATIAIGESKARIHRERSLPCIESKTP